jgi:molecular chaperone DnaK
VFTKLIERNTTIPTRKSEVFTTAADGQTSVEVHVLQGEREMAEFNKTLGRFQLVGIPPAPRGIPQVEVTFDIDANGIVHVSAKDRATGNEQKITITASSGLTEDEIKKMMSDAEDHAEEDRRRREEAETRNRADELVYTTEKSLRELSDKVDAGEKAKIEAAIGDVKEALKGSDVQAIKAAMDNLVQASHKLAEQVYAQASAAGGAPGAGEAEPGSTAGEEEVIDADYEVMDDEKG